MYAKLKEEPQKVAETDKYFRLKSSTILLAITEHVVVEGRTDLPYFWGRIFHDTNFLTTTKTLLPLDIIWSFKTLICKFPTGK